MCHAQWIQSMSTALHLSLSCLLFPARGVTRGTFLNVLEFTSLIFQNHLVGFCSSSVLSTDCTEELAIALRDIPVFNTILESHSLYTELCTAFYGQKHTEEIIQKSTATL